MLEFVEDNKKVKLWYRFNSAYSYGGYEKYDLDEFDYEVDIDDVKDAICEKLCKVIDSVHPVSVLDALNELDSWECVDWLKIIKNCDDLVKEYFKNDAMTHFMSNHEEVDEE